MWSQMRAPIRIDRVVVLAVGPEELDATSVERAVADPTLSARCTFTGTVRDSSRGKRAMFLDYTAYTPMAERELARIGAEAVGHWPGARVGIAHRTGRLEIGEASVIVSVAADATDSALGCCEWVVDQLKIRVPIWKKEFGPDGSHWVEGPGEHRTT